MAYDVRGHGASDKPAAFSMADHVADLLGLCCALGLTRPALVGFSMGSYITLRTAELHPHAFGRIVLIVHGTADKVVDLSYARRAAESTGPGPPAPRPWWNWTGPATGSRGATTVRPWGPLLRGARPPSAS